jgi:hypothetical protein
MTARRRANGSHDSGFVGTLAPESQRRATDDGERYSRGAKSIQKTVS